MITLTDEEVKAMAKSPFALRDLANIHDCWETEADAIGDFEKAVLFHSKRAQELRDEANRIEAEY